MNLSFEGMDLDNALNTRRKVSENGFGEMDTFDRVGTASQ